MVASVSLSLMVSPALAAAMPTHTARPAIVAQAGPSPTASPHSAGPTTSPSPGAEDDQGGIGTGAGLVIAAILLGGLLLMRNRLLRR